MKLSYKDDAGSYSYLVKSCSVFTLSELPLPGEMMIEPNVGPAVIDALRARGHIVTVAEPWSVGRMTAALRNPDGSLHAAATPRLMQAYAVGR